MEATLQNYIFDFDSTITRVEALDLLAEISLRDRADKDDVVRKIKEITNLGIDGDISFTESLQQRIALIGAHRDHLPELVEILRTKVSHSIVENREFFEQFRERIYIISCGFKEFIDPIMEEYSIPAERVFANTFAFDESGLIVGFDSQNVLSQHNGKIDCLKSLDLQGEVQVVGDGYSDYVMKEAGLADKFFAFTENVHREKAAAKADFVTPNLNEFLYVNNLPRKVSFPKNRIRILLLENIHEAARENLEREGFNVEWASTSLTEDELVERIRGVHVLGIRSKTQVTDRVLESADKLLAIGAFCIGTTQISLQTAKNKGIVVFNAPYSNTRSVVELAIGQIIMLMRHTFQRSMEMHSGEWNKTAMGSREVRGKILGVVGYGNIGKQLSVLAEAVGMRVYYYDISDQLALGNAVRCRSLEELLEISDVVTLHVDDNPENRNFFGKEELALMKRGSHLINLSRGFVVDLEALVIALKAGHIAGAAIDVYPTEPRANGPFTTELQNLPNVILTPHVGGSTEEAQYDIAHFVPAKITEYVNSGSTEDSVNFPNIRLPRQKGVHRFLHIHHNVPGVMAEINRVLANYEINITGQYLSTDPEVGYVITDIGQDYNREVSSALRTIENTIKFRVLY